MSLSSVVSSLVRASMGTSVSSTVTDDELDRHVAELILKEAKQKAERYSKEGVHAYLRRQPLDSNVPRANKRFLTSIIKSTDEHNKTVLRAQALAAAEIKKEIDEVERRERMIRAEEAVAARKLMERGGKRRLLEEEAWDRWDGRRSSRKRRSRRHDTDEEDEDVSDSHRKKRRRSRSRDRSDKKPERSRHHRHRHKSHERSQSPSQDDDKRRGSSRHDKHHSQHSRSLSRSRSPKHAPSDQKDLAVPPPFVDSDEEIGPPPPPSMPPPPPPDAPPPPSAPPPPLPTGSSRYRSLSPPPQIDLPSKMDKYFQESYDPRLDVAPLSTTPSVPATGLIDSADFDGWDAMLDLIRIRREDKAEKKRLERLGIVPDKTKRKKGSLETSGMGDRWSEGGTSVMDIQYSKKGSVREWDMGKEGF